jgi:hypothetical protein
MTRGARVDLNRPQTLSGLVRTGASLYAAYPGLFLVLSFAVVAPYELIVLAVTGVSPLGRGTATAATVFTLLLLDFALIGPLVSALYVRALLAVARSERPRLTEVASEVVRLLPVVAAAQIVAGLGIGLGLIVFVLPGVLLAVRWAVVAQAAAVEGTDWMGALRRSAELVRGSYGHALWVLVFTGVFNFVVVRLADAAAGPHTRAPQVILGIAIDTLTRSVAALFTAVLYFDLRSRELLRRQAAS